MASGGTDTGTQTETILKDSNREAELFIDAAPPILIGLDGRGRIKRWNESAAETFGLKGTQVLGKPMARCGIPWLTPGVDSLIEGFLRSQHRLSHEGMRFERNGEPRLLGMTVNWIRFPHGGGGELLIVASDITEKRRAHDELLSQTAFLEAQIQASIDGILVVDEQGHIAQKNQRFLELFDIPKALWNNGSDDVLLQDVLHKVEKPETFLERVRHLYVHKKETSRDEIKLRNGMVLDRYSSPVFGKDGRYYGRIWTFRDITERMKNEEALRQLSVAVEQSPVLVVITDLKGNITYVNRRFTECTGYSSEEAIGQNPRLLKSGHTSAEEYRQLWQTIRRGEEWRGELRNRKKNGDLYWESVVISPIRGAAGETLHFLAIKEDITKQKEAESHARQVQKLEAIGQLAAGIAHEINTPIQFVGDNIRFIKEAWGALDPFLSLCRSLEAQSMPLEFVERLGRLREQSDWEYLQSEMPTALEQSLEGIARVAKIVLAMKAFSHPGSDEKQPSDINQAILTTLTVSRNEWKYVADVETVLQRDMQLVPCHPNELNQVLLNLLINATHAIAEVVGEGCAVKGKITIRTTQDENAVTISIADTGTGIPPQFHSRIFDPFFTTKAVGRGTGQGLALAHNSIVKRHGGKIWFESEVGRGTIFYIALPMTGGTHSHGEADSVCR